MQKPNERVLRHYDEKCKLRNDDRGDSVTTNTYHVSCPTCIQLVVEEKKEDAVQ